MPAARTALSFANAADENIITIDTDSAPRIMFYGEDFLCEDLPVGTRVIYPRRPIAGLPNPRAAIRYALHHPESMEPLHALLFPGMKVTIAVDDISLPLPPMVRPDIRETILDIVLEMLADHGVDDTHIIIATSLHRRMHDWEVRRMVGDKIYNAYWPDRLYNHDACDPEQLVQIGKTAHNEVVETNPNQPPQERPEETGLFQRAPSTPEEMEQGKPVPLSPEAVGELTEEQWYAQAYRGGAAQLTPRAILMGGVLGFLLAFTNLYVGLKTGWHLGVTITACILSFSIWGFFTRVGIAKTSMTILENNCMASTASAAGYATGGTMVSAIPALLMLSATPDRPEGVQLPWPVLGAWTFCLAILGTLLAIPMKRNMINQERLRFPTGTAAATTLKSLYSQGEEAIAKGRALMIAAAISGVLPIIKDLDIFKINIFKGLAGALGVMDATGKLSRTAHSWTNPHFRLASDGHGRRQSESLVELERGARSWGRFGCSRGAGRSSHYGVDDFRRSCVDCGARAHGPRRFVDESARKSGHGSDGTWQSVERNRPLVWRADVGVGGYFEFRAAMENDRPRISRSWKVGP